MDRQFSHMDSSGSVRMVDVGHKRVTVRRAVVEAIVVMNEQTMRLLREAALPKGDVLTTAKIAGIMAAKRCAELIPMCHQIALSSVDIRFETGVYADFDPSASAEPCVRLEAEARSADRTGVEMEAILAAQIAAATIYDMCKAVQKDIRIASVRLLLKEGGKSGLFQSAPLRLFTEIGAEAEKGVSHS